MTAAVDKGTGAHAQYGRQWLVAAVVAQGDRWLGRGGGGGGMI